MATKRLLMLPIFKSGGASEPCYGLFDPGSKHLSGVNKACNFTHMPSTFDHTRKRSSDIRFLKCPLVNGLILFVQWVMSEKLFVVVMANSAYGVNFVDCWHVAGWHVVDMLPVYMLPVSRSLVRDERQNYRMQELLKVMSPSFICTLS